MKQTHPAVWRAVSLREKVNPRRNPADGRRFIADYVETLECGHTIKFIDCDEEPRATRRSCDDCRKAQRTW